LINDQEYVAHDCGGAIKGNRIDIYMSSHEKALEWGVQNIEIFKVVQK
jgi:3D (Asp-Asp-Asp) domain-containing protein